MSMTTSDRTRAVWRSRMGSAFRTTLACTIVGCATLYGPATLQRHVSFPAFSYVTVILIVTDATLGDALRGTWHAFYGSLQGVIPAILSLWAIGPARLNNTNTTALVVALSSFVVVLPESTHLIAKRIALGQIVIVYVVAFIKGSHTEPVMHPLHLAASTALGALACVVALAFPYPRLACYEVRHRCKQFAENATDRLNFFVNAFCAESNTSAQAFISQAKPLSRTGARLLQNIKLKQESMLWEKPWLRFLKPRHVRPEERLQHLEIPLRGMELALTAFPSFPVSEFDHRFKDDLLRLGENMKLTLKQATNCLPCDSSTVPEAKVEASAQFLLHNLQTFFPTQKELPTVFFLFCFKLLHDESLNPQSTSSAFQNQPQIKAEDSKISHKQKENTFKRILKTPSLGVNTERLVLAIKCSLSLGLAVLFGLMFSKENGYWSGLPVAISIAAGREATFKIANVKAQGTVLGTIYGVLGCFVFQRFTDIRFLSLLPWIAFTCFLRRSRMYGQAGGISAVIGALLILGRKNFGPASEFAIARITETFIGLSCFIMVEILLQPTRAFSLAKIQLSQSLRTLHECIDSLVLQPDQPNAGLAALKENTKKLKTQISELRKLITEAEAEPNFWFLPFHGGCYNKLHGSLLKMVDLLLFGSHAIGLVLQGSNIFGVACKELQDHINGDLEVFKKNYGSVIRCLGEVSSIKSLKALERELEKKNISYDLELGKSPNASWCRISGPDDDEMEKLITSLLRHSKEGTDKIHAAEGEEETKSQMILCLSSLGFCMRGLMRETKELEKGISQLVQWENPSSHINLYDISCKINALYA